MLRALSDALLLLALPVGLYAGYAVGSAPGAAAPLASGLAAGAFFTWALVYVSAFLHPGSGDPGGPDGLDDRGPDELPGGPDPPPPPAPRRPAKGAPPPRAWSLIGRDGSS